MTRFRLCLLASTLLAAGCNMAPDYKVPETAPAASAYKETGQWEKAVPADEAPRGEWWKIFGDKDLDTLEAQVTPANQNLAAAVARYHEALALAGESQADLFPTISGNASAARNRQSDNGPLFKEGSSPKFYNDYIANMALSYEVDVWGRVRNAVAAANAGAQASAADLATLDLMQHADLASDYFTLRGYDELQKLLDSTVETYSKALTLTENRHNGKIASEIDVDQAETQLESARAQAEDIRLKRAQMEHAIAVLVGQSASSFSLPAGGLIKNTPPLDPGLPASLLERRPDVAAAERRVFAANAEIGVARAAYFPTIDLAAMVGVEGHTLGDWLTAPSHMWSLGPTATMPLFDAGFTASLNEEARAQYDETVANYRQTVLSAYQETEDALVAQRQLDRESVSQVKAAQAAQRALTQANRQYTAGLVDYLQVVTAQTTALQNQEAATNIEIARLNTSVALIQALGGGWDRETNPLSSNAAESR